MASGSHRPRYTEEPRSDAVALVRRSGRPISHVAKELGVGSGTLGDWIRQSEARLSDDEKAELEEQRRLRKRIKELEEEIEILKRFTAYWVKEGGK
ncbi:MAG: transposase [Acidimicrobiales bacterium]